MRRLTLVVFAMMLAACSVGGPPEVASPTPTTELTATPTPASTPTATPTATPAPTLAIPTVEVGLTATPDIVPDELVGVGWINQFDGGWVVGILGDPRRLRTTEPLIPQAVAGETVIATMSKADGTESTMRLLDLSTGETQAEFPSGVTGPVVRDRTMFFSPTTDLRTDPGLFAIDLQSGEVREVLPPGPLPPSVGAVAYRSNTLSLDSTQLASAISAFNGVDATSDSVVTIIDVETETPTSTFPTEGGPLHFGTDVLVVWPLNDVAGIRASSGAELWRLAGDSYYRSYLADGRTLVQELQRSGDTYVRQIVAVDLETGSTQVLLDADVALWPQVSNGRAAVVSADDQFSSAVREGELVVADVVDVATGVVTPGGFQISLAIAGS